MRTAALQKDHFEMGPLKERNGEGGSQQIGSREKIKAMGEKSCRAQSGNRQVRGGNKKSPQDSNSKTCEGVGDL